ncbi:MAG: response regulator [Pseudomonadota bacterium]
MKPKLLVVDDEPDMLDFFERALRADFKVTRALSGEEALQRIAEGDYEVLITDHKMPRMSGIELIEALGNRYPSLVTVLISGFSDSCELQAAIRDHGIHGYLVKPIDSEGLRTLIEKTIARARSQSSCSSCACPPETKIKEQD